MAELGEGGVTANLEMTEGGAPCIAIAGELDFSNAEGVRTVVDEALANDPEELVFDLEKLSFMDSSGIAVLVHASNHARVLLRRPTPIVLRVIEVTGLTGTFTVAE
ncbi:MAG TPA: STAS domain-containing protein [Acidimicrobiales bacterium]|nr:STAS domain-containing protein [Acidimicrobiales bacterium]